MMEQYFLGSLRDKPDGGCEVFDGQVWKHYSDHDAQTINTMVFDYLNPSPTHTNKEWKSTPTNTDGE